MGKKLQPKLRFRGFTDAWEQRKGAEVICVRRDNIANPPKDIVDVELENLIEGGGLQGDLSLRTASTSVFHEHDTLFGRLRPYLRKFWFANTSGVKSGEIWSLYSSTLKPEFLYALTQSAQFLNQALQTAGTKMPRAEWKTIAEAYFAVPQAEEQEKIGILFQKLEQLIDAEKRKLDLLQKKKRALLRQIFEQKLRFAGYNNPWERCRLGDITEFADYGIAASAIPYDGTVRYLRITDIDDETRQVNIYELPSPDMKHRSRKEDYLRQGDLVFARTGASVGKTYLNRSDRDDIVHAGFLIRFRLKDNICPEFIYQQTLGENYRKFIAITSQRSGQPGINSSEYADWTLYLTSIEEQNQIGGLFGQLDELIAALTQKIDLLMIKKKALLQQMFV